MGTPFFFPPPPHIQVGKGIERGLDFDLRWIMVLEILVQLSKGLEVIPWNFAMAYVQMSKWILLMILKDVIPAGLDI